MYTCRQNMNVTNQLLEEHRTHCPILMLESV